MAEMNGPGAFLACRLVPLDGSSIGRSVGPQPAGCTHAGWSLDGSWMYFSASTPGEGSPSHLWRQRFPDGPVEQLTSGPTEEEGLAVSPDGRSLITSVGVRQRAVWLHDDASERQVSLEGNATAQLLSADGQRVYYLVQRGSRQRGRELRVTDVKSGRTERLFPSMLVTGFDLSQDDRIVAAVAALDGGEQLWLTSADGRTAPRPIPKTERTQQSVEDSGGSQPRFGRAGEIIFRAGRDRGVLRVNEDGSGLRQLTTQVFSLDRASPDGAWISGMWGSGTPPPIWLFSLTGDDRLLFLKEGGGGYLRWAPDGSRLYVSRPNSTGNTYVVPLAKGSMLPAAMPPGGFRTEAEIAALPGVQIIPHIGISPGSTPDVYVFSRETGSRNIFQIPVR
jgi:Tol biopolymer transport system component